MAAMTGQFKYVFDFSGRETVNFTVFLDGLSRYVPAKPAVPPEWSRLSSHQCVPCTLTAEQHPFCPVACNIAQLVTAFKYTISHAQCVVSCSSIERTVTKKTTVQEGLASILGLLMATSGCPILDFFRPMARFHLPFSTVEESIFRVVAMYMLRQYYKQNKRQEDPLNEIRTHYAKVQQVNAGLLDRIRHISALDADKNAIITLNSLSQILEMEIDANLESLQYLFITEDRRQSTEDRAETKEI